MPQELPVSRVLAERVRAQRLTGPRPADAVKLVREIGSLQAQDPRALPLAVRARSDGLGAADVRAAFAEPGRLLTTWLMRGTLHTVPAQDARWLVELFRPPRTAGRTRRLRLGLADELIDRALPVIAELLADGPLTRSELVDRLAARGIRIGPGQAPAHLVGVAAREVVLCRGPERDDEPTYVLLDA